MLAFGPIMRGAGAPKPLCESSTWSDLIMSPRSCSQFLPIALGYFNSGPRLSTRKILVE